MGRDDRRGLSQLINYMARPPTAEERLERNDAGEIGYRLKQPWSDGTAGIKLSPSELIEKLIALIPPRSSPMVRYGGVFAPNFKRRDEIILRPGMRKRKVSLGSANCGGKSKKTKVGAGAGPGSCVGFFQWKSDQKSDYGLEFGNALQLHGIATKYRKPPSRRF